MSTGSRRGIRRRTAFERLGLHTNATATEVRAARRHLAKEHHPDAGGKADDMREVNAAATEALQLIADREIAGRYTAGRETVNRETAGRKTAGRETADPEGDGTVWSGESGRSRDIASFVIEALPLVAYEALLAVTSWLGEVVDDDPPYRLEVHLGEPHPCWCLLELVPDAGASTVSLTVASLNGQVPDVETIRDLWVLNLNRLTNEQH